MDFNNCSRTIIRPYIPVSNSVLYEQRRNISLRSRSEKLSRSRYVVSYEKATSQAICDYQTPKKLKANRCATAKQVYQTRR